MEEEGQYNNGEKTSIGIVIPTAGKGERMSMAKPKQFLSISGKPVIAHTINSFAPLSNCIKSIVVPVGENFEEVTSTIVKEHVLEKLQNKVLIIQGSTTRHRSIMLGVNQLEKYKVNITIIHDAVRPIVDVPLLRRLIDAAIKYGAAGSVTKLCSTVVQISDGSFLEQSLDRHLYVESHTPQAFQQKILLNAYENASDVDLENGTECLALVDKQLLLDGRTNGVKLIEGNPNFLWKITHRKDLLNGINRDALLNSTDDANNLGDLLDIKLINNPCDLKDNHLTFLNDIHSLLSSFSSQTLIGTSTESLKEELNEMTTNYEEEEYPAIPNSIRCECNVIIRFSENEDDFICQIRELECNINSKKMQSNILIFVLENTPTLIRVKVIEELDSLVRRGVICILYFSPKDKETSPNLVYKFRKQLHQIITCCLLQLQTFSSQVFFVGL